jgi:23S rRNA (cytosine1962-C5)-methyltransferase
VRLRCFVAARETWDVVICDPPSFAPNKAAVPKAQASYERLFEMAARVTTRYAVLDDLQCPQRRSALLV